VEDGEELMQYLRHKKERDIQTVEKISNSDYFLLDLNMPKDGREALKNTC